MRCSNGVAAPSHPTYGYIKKQVTSEDKMNSVVTYVNIRLKCYINLFTWFYVVPKRMGSCDVLANAINKLDESLIKKISKSINPTS